jgi:hypothetical protein
VIDTGANYWSLWNWHNVHATHVMNYYNQFPQGIDRLNRMIGYRVRPSWIWRYDHGTPDSSALVLGLVNDGIAGVPGILRIHLVDAEDHSLVSGSLDPGLPAPRGVRQARLVVPAGLPWEGLRLKAEIEVKGVCHPVPWACREVNADGTLTLIKQKTISYG